MVRRRRRRQRSRSTPPLRLWRARRSQRRCAGRRKDLLSDFTKVFGQAPKLVEQPGRGGSGGDSDCQNPNLPPGDQVRHRNGHGGLCIFRCGGRGRATHQRVVCLTGADMRGTIFAIYEFSAEVSGRRPDVSVDRQAAGEADVDHAAGRISRTSIPARSSSIAASLPTTKTC